MTEKEKITCGFVQLGWSKIDLKILFYTHKSKLGGNNIFIKQVPSTSDVQENAAKLFYCKASEMVGLRNFTRLAVSMFI